MRENVAGKLYFLEEKGKLLLEGEGGFQGWRYHMGVRLKERKLRKSSIMSCATFGETTIF